MKIDYHIFVDVHNVVSHKPKPPSKSYSPICAVSGSGQISCKITLLDGTRSYQMMF